MNDRFQARVLKTVMAAMGALRHGWCWPIPDWRFRARIMKKRTLAAAGASAATDPFQPFADMVGHAGSCPTGDLHTGWTKDVDAGEVRDARTINRECGE
jgi:hypothetical protein